MKKLVLPALLALTLAACSSTGPENGAASVQDRGTGVATVTAGSAKGSGIAALTDPNNILSKRSVFFDFDSFVIKQEARPLIEAHARFLVQNPQMNMLVQGNTDERGSREYNLALGQKRADAVKRAMTAQGVSDNQIETISFGEEKPKATGQTEEAYAQNRRADINYEGAGK